MFWKNFIKLCAEKGVSPNAVARELSISSGAVTKWKNGATPQNAKLRLIADYFGVTVEYFFIDHKETKTTTPTFISYQHDNEDARKLLANMQGHGAFDITAQKEKPTDYGELKENVVIYHRDGKTVKKTFTKEQMAILRAMLDAAPDDDEDDI